MKAVSPLAALVVVLNAAWAGASGSAPVAVSPASSYGVALVEARCPTFSWGEVDGALSYELVVYRVGEQVAATEPVLQRTFPGSADTWTPSLDACLERGGRYAWSVRAIGGRETSDWSPPSLFGVASGPSEAEFEEALSVVRQYLAAEAGETLSALGAASEDMKTTPPAPSPSQVRRLIGPASAVNVNGNVDATSFTGNGSGLTAVDADTLDSLDSFALIQALATTVVSSSGSGQICVSCPAGHPFMTGGACEKIGVGIGFGPETTIDATTYCCEDASAGNPVGVSAVCATVE